MNICIVTSSFPINNSEIYHRFIDDLIEILKVNNHKITILTQDKKGEKEKFHDDIDIVWFPWKMTKKNVLAEVSFRNISNIISTLSLIFNGVKAVKRLKKEQKIDVFICLWAIPSGFYLFANNLLFGKTPYITWSLGSDIYNYRHNFITRLLLKKILKGASSRFADGYELCNIIEKISNKECKFLPTFSEISNNNLEINNEYITPNNGNINFLYVGRLSYVKGVDILIEALDYFKRNTNINFICNIVGDGDLYVNLMDLVVNKGLEKNIIFHGKVTEKSELAKFFCSANCLIIPSRSESIPIVLCEALQYNLPLIVTNVGDMAKIVNENKLGFVVENSEPESFFKVFIMMIESNLKLNDKDCKKTLNNLTFKFNEDLIINAL